METLLFFFVHEPSIMKKLLDFGRGIILDSAIWFRLWDEERVIENR